MGIPGVVGMYWVKNEARWISESLQRSFMVAEHIVLFDDNSTDNTVQLAKVFGDKITVIPSPFEGLDETRDKNLLWKEVQKRNPRWVFLLDGDEVFTFSAIDEIRAIVSNPLALGIWKIRIIYLWDRLDQERCDHPYNAFYASRLWSVYNQVNLASLEYRQSGFGGNFHCGPMPAGIEGQTNWLRCGALHYGYLYKEDRDRKLVFYQTKDPGNQLEGEYLHIVGIPDRVAPGPVQFRPLVER